MKARYHKFTGDVPVVFVEDAMKFMGELGVELNEDQKKSTDLMHEVTIGPLTMLVFSEAWIRTIEGKLKTSVVEAHLALWEGMRKYPTNEVRAYKYAMALAERYNRARTHEVLRRKLAETHGINVRSPKTAAEQKPVEAHLFTEQQQLVFESLSLSDMKKKAMALIKSADEEITRKVFSLLNRNNTSYEDSVVFLTKIGIPEKYAKEILNVATETGDLDLLTKYFKNRTMNMADVEKGDLVAAVNKAIPGISDAFVRYIITYKWPASPSMGSGEVAVIMLMKNGNKPAKGDAAIGSKEIEVKGANGRIKGQKGYGPGIAAGMTFEKSFKEYMKKLPKDKQIEVPKAGGRDYQITKKNAFPNKWMEHLIANGALTQAQAVKIWQNAIKALFLNMDVSWVKKHVSNRGTIDNVTAFHKQWLAAALNYYHSIEGFETILMVSDRGKTAVLSPKDFPNAWDKVKVTGVPSFTSAAGPQGPTYGISVK